jgi:signal transduction histidine kinase
MTPNADPEARRVPRRLPWVLWGLIIALLGLALALGTRNASLSGDPLTAGILSIMVVGYSTVGAVLSSRVPRNPIGWLMMVVGSTFAVGIVTSEYAVYALRTSPGSLPGASVAVWLTNCVDAPGAGALLLALLLFPTGVVPSRRWRPLPALIVGLVLAAWVVLMLMPGPVDVSGDFRTSNPTGIERLDDVMTALQNVIGYLLLAVVLATLVAMVMRYRRARAEERQQLRWLVAVVVGGVAVTAFGTLLSVLTGSIGGGQALATGISDWVWVLGFALLGIGIPGAMAVAILRFHLYDLDIVIKKTVIYGLLVALFLVKGGLLVPLAGLLIVGTAGGWAMAFIAIGVVLGLLYVPLRRVATRAADRLVYGRRATPYQVLTSFSEQIGGTFGSEDVLPRMAEVLGSAVGAAVARVWLRLGSRLVPTASSPDGPAPLEVAVRGDEPPRIEGESAFEVRYRGELLGALSVRMHPNDPMNPSKERLIRDLASQAGLVLRNVRLIEELRGSRQRLVAAQDEERRRLERNIHDGAQQQLVALNVQLGLAKALAPRDTEATMRLLSDLQVRTEEALSDLRDLARGIYPPLLADKGLTAAVEAQARKSPVPVTVSADGIGRYPQEAEAAVYFSVMEALQNVAKYADATAATVSLTQRDGTLAFDVTDDGRGFDPDSTGYGTGLQGISDRVAALGGALDVQSGAGLGTVVPGRLPVPSRGAGR